ncbi:hypothetical protein C8J57DRAFT_1227248 [Mycena rebaudengoi]|nr:hypothetical protein C8J57DRAFT_1227248 [Mycena rebaudengoi]
MGGTTPDDEFDELRNFAQAIPDGPGTHTEHVEKCHEGIRTIALAHMGISISLGAIHSAIHSLSVETMETLRTMGQTLLVGYAYNNFDINFPTIVRTIEKVGDPLTHGTIICLEHDVVLEDLECSEELWAKSALNPTLESPPPCEEHNLEAIHPKTDHPSGLTRCECFNAYKFKLDLFEYGPAEFHNHLKVLESPESVEQIPLVKMDYAPTRAMDTNQLTHAGNITAIGDLIHRAGLVRHLPLPIPQRKHLQNLVSLLKYAILFFGDLGTAERAQRIFLRRSIEGTPWLHYQFVVFVMGFFHLKMACANAIWRIFIKPKWMPTVSWLMLPNIGLGKLVEGKHRNSTWNSLEDFAKSKPSLTLLNDMANHLVKQYVSGGEVVLYALHSELIDHCDKQHENTLIMHQCFLLYEELSFSMNHGDVGWLETTFPLGSLYSRRRAVRYNSLVNLTGIFNEFCGVDWVEESMINLYTKHTFGGSGSNYTKA